MLAELPQKNTKVDPQFYVINNSEELSFQEIYDNRAIFGKLADPLLIEQLLDKANQCEYKPNTITICMKKGFHNNANNSGFSLTHIVGRWHHKGLKKYYGINDSKLIVIKFVKDFFENLKHNLDIGCAFIAYETNRKAIVFAVYFPNRPPKLQYGIAVCYIDKIDETMRLMIGTIYIANFNKFRLIKNGNKKKNYQPLVTTREREIFIEQLMMESVEESKDAADTSKDLKSVKDSYGSIYRSLIIVKNNSEPFNEELKDDCLSYNACFYSGGIEQFFYMNELKFYENELCNFMQKDLNSLEKEIASIEKFIEKNNSLKKEFKKQRENSYKEYSALYSKYLAVTEQYSNDVDKCIRWQRDFYTSLLLSIKKMIGLTNTIFFQLDKPKELLDKLTSKTSILMTKIKELEKTKNECITEGKMSLVKLVQKASLILKDKKEDNEGLINFVCINFFVLGKICQESGNRDQINFFEKKVQQVNLKQEQFKITYTDENYKEAIATIRSTMTP